MTITINPPSIEELWMLLRERLASHEGRADRSAAAWKEFCDAEVGPDVSIPGSKNRLDIILRHRRYGSIGIEVKCLGASGHAGKLTQGVGQALLGLANRDRTLLVIHCGTVESHERQRLREVGIDPGVIRIDVLEHGQRDSGLGRVTTAVVFHRRLLYALPYASGNRDADEWQSPKRDHAGEGVSPVTMPRIPGPR
jgi:hypothetical protein